MGIGLSRDQRGLPRSRASGTADTTGDAIAIPGNTVFAKVVVSGDAYTGFGADAEPPTANAGNTGFLISPGEIYQLGDAGGLHLYLYARADTVDYEVSFYG